jgi:curved DNA-binding protein CbpA
VVLEPDDRVTMIDPYAELGVPLKADRRAIRKAYLARARQYHPDLGGNVERMARINAAYELLGDPQLRAAYDSSPSMGLARRRAAEPWTGAAGVPSGRPSGSVLEFGLFAGWSVGQIARRDPGYLVWLAERREGRPYLAEIEALLAPLRAHSTKSR